MRKVSQFIMVLCFFTIIAVGFCGYALNGEFIDSAKQTYTETINQARTDNATRIEKLKLVRDAEEALINDLVPHKFDYINLFGLFNRIIGKHDLRAGFDGVIKNTDGTLTNFQNDSLINADEITQKPLDSVVKLKKDLNKRGIDLLYIVAPVKSNPYDSKAPAGTYDITNDAADHFVDRLRDSNVDVMDLRTHLHDSGRDWADSFFITDHHWKPETSLWAGGVIAEYLNSEYEMHLDTSVFDASRYNYEVYEKKYLGSWGRRVGKYFAGMDDLSVITPKFETNITSIVPQKNREITGSFEETLLDKDFLKEENYKNYFLNEMYWTYTGSNFKNQKIINHNQSNVDEKILFIRESFACALTPFFALSTNAIDTIDLRVFQEPDNLMEYIDENNPKLVIILYNASIYTDSEFFDFPY